MQVTKKYSHLNGEEYLLVHQPELYKEIQDVIAAVDASKFKTKESQEERKKGRFVYAPTELNKEFARIFSTRSWKSVTRKFYVSDDPHVVKLLEPLSFQEQRRLLEQLQHTKIDSFNQTDFVKDQGNRFKMEKGGKSGENEEMPDEQ